MNIINSSTTGHNRSQEKNFSKKLFIGLGIAVAAAMIFFLLVGQRKDMSIAPTTETESSAILTPASEQPKK